MSRELKHSPESKLEIVRRFLNGESASELADEFIKKDNDT